jgi:DNA-directed RNA polymerase specialized sigma24 family protein
MRRSTAMGLLPVAHARVLDLAEQALDPLEMADRLGVVPSAVGPLLRVARSKLAALLALDEPPDGLDHIDPEIPGVVFIDDRDGMGWSR